MILLLALGACSQSRGHDLAACKLEAIKAYPSRSAGNYFDRNHHTYLCMKSKGYVLNKDCPALRYGDDIIEDCYRKPWPWE
jgi:hypothetical protein